MFMFMLKLFSSATRVAAVSGRVLGGASRAGHSATAEDSQGGGAIGASRPADAGGTDGAIGAVTPPRRNSTPDHPLAEELESEEGTLRASTPGAGGVDSSSESGVCGTSSSSHINGRE